MPPWPPTPRCPGPSTPRGSAVTTTARRCPKAAGRVRGSPLVGTPTTASTTAPRPGGAAGTGMPTVNTVLVREYPSIKSDWQTMFGSPPSPEDVYNVLQHGTSPTQWTDYIRSLPGHITGMSVGQIYDLRALVDGASMKALGHAGTDGIVKELRDQSMTSEAQVKLWYDEHSPNDLDKTTYKEIVKANQPVMTSIFNDSGFDPRIASQQALQDKRVAGGHGAIA